MRLYDFNARPEQQRSEWKMKNLSQFSSIIFWIFNNEDINESHFTRNNEKKYSNNLENLICFRRGSCELVEKWWTSIKFNGKQFSLMRRNFAKHRDDIKVHDCMKESCFTPKSYHSSSCLSWLFDQQNSICSSTKRLPSNESGSFLAAG